MLMSIILMFRTINMSMLCLLLLGIFITSGNAQCFVKPTLENPYSVATLNESEYKLTKIACFTCTCAGKQMPHYVIDLVRINYPTYCNRCFSILNLTSTNTGSTPNYCLYFMPGVTPISYSRGPVFDMTIECVVENTATTLAPAVTVPVATTVAPVVTTVPAVPATTAAAVPTIPATTVAVTGPTVATTIGSTVVATTGSTVAATTGSTVAATTGSTVAATTGSTVAATTGSTVAATTGSTVAATTGSTVAATTGSTVAATTGSTVAATTGSTVAATTGSTVAATTGSTVAATAGSTVAATAGSTVAATIGSTVALTTTIPPTTTVNTATTAPATTQAPATIPPFLRDEGTIQVRVIVDQPPYFELSSTTVSKNAQTVNDNGIVYTVSVTDPELDPIFFTLEVDPPNSNFYIDGAGNVRAVKSLRGECSSASYTFKITATDNKHDPVGPHVATVHLTGTSTAPTARGLNKEFFYKETLRVPTFINKWSTSSDTKKTVLKFKPTNARTRFKIVGNTIRTSEKMDYETFPKINITFTLSNDNCESKYYLLIRIGDVNDIPILSPPEQSLKVDEGKVQAQPNYIITDNDLNDRHTFSFYRDRSRGYNIDPFTGAISHPTGIIIDKTVEQDVVFQVVVTDENGPRESNKILVKLLIQDINNHAPEFLVKSFTERATACDDPKRLPITLEVEDQDSALNGNGDWSVIPITSGPLSITHDGAAYMTTKVVPGETYSVQAYAKDHGVNPGSLTSIVPVTITLIGLPCPPVLPVATASTVTSNSNSGSGSGGSGTGSGSSSNSQSSSNSNSNTINQNSQTSTTIQDASDDTAAIVLGVLFGLLLLAALAYLIWRFVLPRFCPGAYNSLSYSCSNCSERCCPSKSNSVRPRGGEGNYDFWKEDYNNGSYNNTNHRSARPAPFRYYE